MVVLNKIDLLQEAPKLALSDDRVLLVVATSCATGAGIDDLKRALFELVPPVAEAPPPASGCPSLSSPRPRPRRGPRFRILRAQHGYRVVGTPPPADELEEALRRIGVKRGAQVEVGDEELESQ